MSLQARKTIQPCCASWTAACCRALSSSSTSQAATQAKAKPRVYQDYTANSSTSRVASFHRDPLPASSSYNSFPNRPRAPNSTGATWRPAERSKERTGVNKLGSTDSGWGPRRPLPTIPISSGGIFGGGERRSASEGWDLTGRNGRQNRTNTATTQDRRVNPRSSTPMGCSNEADYAEPTKKTSYADSDVLISGRSMQQQRTQEASRVGRERYRKEEESKDDLRLERERQEQRAILANKVIKGVAKFKEIKKARDVFLGRHVSVGILARLFGVRLDRLQRSLQKAGMTEVSYDHLLDSEDAALLAPEFGCNVVIDEGAAFDVQAPPLPADLTTLPHRPPVVTIMGHVDHGKTTLLDTLRSASVASGEAGGITQHIGAFTLPVSSLSTSKKTKSTTVSKEKDERMITFLDTPGHAAFSAMRARGAMATDVIILVVAADDGVMPQTKEVIELAKKEHGRVGLVVAINKVDKPGADPMTVKQMLLAEGVQLEEFGGDVPAVEVSGLTGQGLDNLMETVSLVSELMDVRAETKGTAVGHVLESKVVKGFGAVATVLLLRGELTPGSHLIAGTVACRVRSLTSSTGQTVKSIPPGTAASVSGWQELPNAGDEVIQASEGDIKRALVNRKRNEEMLKLVGDAEAINEKRREERERREQELEATKEALKNGQALQQAKVGAKPEVQEEDDTKTLRLIIKADVSGSAEAVAGALEGIGNDKAKTKIISYSVGNVTEGDVTLAKAIGASIVAFGVQSPRPIAQLALTQAVPIISSDIIYRLMETVQQKVIELLPQIIEYKVVGEANVQQMFEIDMGKKNKLKVAGCRVTNGTLEKGKSIRLMRNGGIVHDGNLDTFRHLKKDITEARKGMECGLSFTKYSGDFLSGDVVQMYETITKPGIL